jgi:hypothetical protein
MRVGGAPNSAHDTPGTDSALLPAAGASLCVAVPHTRGNHAARSAATTSARLPSPYPAARLPIGIRARAPTRASRCLAPRQDAP